ncbi:hypothetical protein DV965_15200, partial [Staphylococcus pseudintermedius]
AKQENKHTVLARDLADAPHIINLAARGFDVNTTSSLDLVNYLSLYMRLHPLPLTRIFTRLGHVYRYFIHPLIKDVALAIYDQGYKTISKEFKTKGTLHN